MYYVKATTIEINNEINKYHTSTRNPDISEVYSSMSIEKEYLTDVDRLVRVARIQTKRLRNRCAKARDHYNGHLLERNYRLPSHVRVYIFHLGREPASKKRISLLNGFPLYAGVE